MSKLLALPFLLALLLAAAPAAALPTDPGDLSLWIQVDGEAREVATAHDDTSFWLESDVALDFASGARIELDAGETYGFFDPVLNLGLSIRDLDAPSVFSFAIFSPLSPVLTGSVDYTATISGRFLDGGSDGGAIGDVSGTGVLEATVNRVPQVGLGGDAVFTTPTDTYGPFTTSGQIDCDALGGCSEFGLGYTYQGSGGGDTLALNLRFELGEPVTPIGPPAPSTPEPTAGLVFGVGLLVLARRLRA